MTAGSFDTPTGPVTIHTGDGMVTALRWGRAGAEVTPLLEAAGQQLAEYFAGQRQAFDLPLAPRGDAFQQRFYAAFRAIPFGYTRTYGALAKELGVSRRRSARPAGPIRSRSSFPATGCSARRVWGDFQAGRVSRPRWRCSGWKARQGC